MTLCPHTAHPSDRSYVVKLHRDARPDSPHLCGRLEHLATGRCLEFADGQQLLAALAHALGAADQPGPTEDSHEEA